MSIPTKRLDALDPTFSPERNHEVAAMRDGISNKLRVEQILALLQSSDIPDAAVTLAKLAADARAAGNHTYDNTASGIDASTPQGAIDILAMGYRRRGAPIKIEESGTYTPDPEVKATIFEVQAAGGASADISLSSDNAMVSSGGNAGGYQKVFWDSPNEQEVTIVIGAGATASESPSAGGDTSISAVGMTVACSGGSSGRLSAASGNFVGIDSGAQGENSATGVAVIVNIRGQFGGPSFGAGPNTGVNNNAVITGSGGSTPFGAGGSGRAGASTNLLRSGRSPAPTAYGAGAGGSGVVRESETQSVDGANGADGVVYIWEFL